MERRGIDVSVASMIEETDNEAGRPSYVALEAVAAVATTAAFTYLSTNIKVSPLDRLGQVSGEASLDFRFTVASVALITALCVAAKLRGGEYLAMTWRLACAALAGLLSGLVAGGLVVALRGTPAGLGGEIGDTGVLAKLAEAMRGGQSELGLYPPLQVKLIAWLADLLGMSALHAMKPFQIIGIAAMGPATYLAWRLLFRPGWALGIGVVAMLPLLEMYRSYPFLSLAVFVPVMVSFFKRLRYAADRAPHQLVLAGVGYGLTLGVLFLLYSGWFLWSTYGAIATGLIVFPWRRGWRRGVLFGGVAAVVFVLVTVRYVLSVAGEPQMRDEFFYFDCYIEPAYIAIWGAARPVSPDVWPPPGELGGVGVFTLVLAAGLGLAVLLGRTRTLVIAVAAMMTSSWLLRFWRAHLMFKTKLVQLYPRTTAEIGYCLAILTGFAVYVLVERARRRSPADHPLRSASAPIGAMCALALVFLSSGSRINDAYMPNKSTDSHGWVAWMGHQISPHTNHAPGATIKTSSSVEQAGWSSKYLNDTGPAGYSSEQTPDDREQTIELWTQGNRRISNVVLVPASDGFPVEATVEVWDGERWLPRVTQRWPTPPTGPQSLSWPIADSTDRVRLRVSRLRQAGATYVLRLAEIEVHP